jgi:hypothetical protein
MSIKAKSLPRALGVRGIFIPKGVSCAKLYLEHLELGEFSYQRG